jgi:site-specific DNA-cytosine methylase
MSWTFYEVVAFFPCPPKQATTLENMLPHTSNTRARDHVVKALRHAAKQGVELATSRIVVDIGASCKFSHYSVDQFPTITSTRAISCDWWIADLGRRVTTDELMFLQGFEKGSIDYKAAKVSEQRVRHMVGNAMSMNILERLLPRALSSVGIYPSRPNLDRWEHAVRACQVPVTPRVTVRQSASSPLA